MTDAEFEVYRTRSLRRSERWRWRLTHANGRILAVSSEGYTDRAEAERIGWQVVTGRYDVAALIAT